MRDTSIYMLHRVLPERPSTPPDIDMTISCKEFDAFLQSKKGEQALTLAEWVRNKEAGGYILTFDDGYKDNLEHALPILEKHNVAATIFITTGFIAGTAYPLERPLYTALQSHKQYETGRHVLKAGCYNKRLKMLETLSGHHRLEKEEGLFMNWDELRKLSQHPLITLMAHSDTHPNLARLNPWQQWKELKIPQRVFQKELGFTPDIFAYPYGGNSTITRILMRLAGYKAGIATRQGKTNAGSDPYRLPRLDIMEAL